MSAIKSHLEQKGLKVWPKASKEEAVLSIKGREFYNSGTTTKKTLFLAAIFHSSISGIMVKRVFSEKDGVPIIRRRPSQYLGTQTGDL